jgi:NAD(P)-dependent dehydrogenase (short-subunit alcohol dehydrogenase family)
LATADAQRDDAALYATTLRAAENDITRAHLPFGSITEELYESIFAINVKGLLFTVQKALPLLPDGSSIILNASVVGSKGLSANSVYSAQKPPCVHSRGHGRRI